MSSYLAGKAWELSSLQGLVESTLGDVPCSPLQEMKLLLDLLELLFHARHFHIITRQPRDSSR